MAAMEGEGSEPGEFYALQGRFPITPAVFLPPVPVLRTPDGDRDRHTHAV
jgi:hypothetical protein